MSSATAKLDVVPIHYDYQFKLTFGQWHDQYADGWIISGCNRVGFATLDQKTFPGHKMELWSHEPLYTDHDERRGSYVYGGMTTEHEISEKLIEQVAHFVTDGDIEELHTKVWIRDEYDDMPIQIHENDYQLLIAPIV